MKCLNPHLSLIAHLKSWRRLRKPESHLTWATEKITTKDAPDVPRKQKQLQKKEPPNHANTHRNLPAQSQVYIEAQCEEF